MFEDSTFASAGVIAAESHKWMIVTFAFNSTLLVAMVLMPLLFPQALPRLNTIFLMAVPEVKLTEPKPVEIPKRAVVVHTSALTESVQMPTRIPDKVLILDHKEIGVPLNLAMMEGEGSSTMTNLAETHKPHVVEAQKAPVRISSMVVEGMLVHRTLPVYPPIARAAHVEGTVVLNALITRDGTIQNLHVVTGNAMLQQAALDAVRSWRYRPYLLNGEPVEVETTVNVIFKLGNY